MTIARTVLHLLALTGALGAMLVALRVWRTHYGLGPESARKLAHTGLGIVSLSFPYVFDHAWPALVLNGMVIAAMAGARTSPALANVIGGVVHDVERRTFGEFYFPIAVSILLLLAGADAARFVVPVLTLTFADAAAALVGARFGHRLVCTAGAMKTVEGSAAFFLVAFACTQVALVRLGAAQAGVSVAIAGSCAAVSTLIEAACTDGTDNLFVPLGCYGALHVMLGSVS